MTTSSGKPFGPGMVVSDKFVLLRLIGEGAMSAVYEATDSLIGRNVAIKILRPQFAANPDVIRRFRREAEATARILHPNVVMVLEMGQGRDGSFYIVQELLVGENLRTRLDARKTLSIDESLEIIGPITGALVAAHGQGIVHRDVKPENIVLARSASGELTPKLVDFGIAKLHTRTGTKNLTEAGSMWGTAAYMSPEQASCVQPVDARTDVWALGVVLLEMLSGVCAYDGPSPQVVVARILSQRAPRLDALVEGAPRALADIIARAIEPDLSRRYPTMQAFRNDLAEFAWGRPRAQAQAMAAPVSVPEEWLDPDDLVPADDPVRRETADPDGLALTPMAPSVFTRVAPALSGFEPSIDAPSTDGSTPAGEEDTLAALADHALGVNNLADAIAHAEGAIKIAPNSADLTGRMRLVQASAHRWLGDYAAAERCAREAADRMRRGGGSWYTAVGVQVTVSGYLGMADALRSILADVIKLEVSPAKADRHAILLCRLAAGLVRVGDPEAAQGIFASLGLNQRREDEPEGADAILQAWIDLARAEIAIHRGDVAAYLRRVESAVDNFKAVGNFRDACLSRSNIGRAYMQLGAHRRAVTALHESLHVAEPMRLDFIAPIKVSLGFALAHLKQLDQAIAVEREGLELCQRQGNRRDEAIAWTYLAAIHSMRDETAHAVAAAEQAVAVASAGPAAHAYALGMLARLLLVQRKPEAALAHAEEAMDLLAKLGGIEEGESLIRWVHALALRNCGREEDGRRSIAEARRRLLECAARINEPQWQKSYLEGVRDNDRLNQLADQWLGTEGP